MITINETKEIITFLENGNVVKQIKRTSRNAQYGFVKKMGIDSFDWDCNEYAKRLKCCAEKYINSFKTNKELPEMKVENHGSFETCSETKSPKIEEAEVKVTSNGIQLQEAKGAGNTAAVPKETTRTFTTEDGDVITVIA